MHYWLEQGCALLLSYRHKISWLAILVVGQVPPNKVQDGLINDESYWNQLLQLIASQLLSLRTLTLFGNQYSFAMKIKLPGLFLFFFVYLLNTKFNNKVRQHQAL